MASFVVECSSQRAKCKQRICRSEDTNKMIRTIVTVLSTAVLSFLSITSFAQQDGADEIIVNPPVTAPEIPILKAPLPLPTPPVRILPHVSQNVRKKKLRVHHEALHRTVCSHRPKPTVGGTRWINPGRKVVKGGRIAVVASPWGSDLLLFFSIVAIMIGAPLWAALRHNQKVYSGTTVPE